jgi:hypothetical protein
MKYNNVYSVLIYFFIFIVIKKSYDIIIDYKFPTYEYIEQADKSLNFLFVIRDIFAFISIVFIFYILFSFKINIFILLILLFLIIQNIIYFIVDKRYIYYFIDKKNINIDSLIFIDGTINNLSNIIVILFSSYILVKIFRS